MKLYKFVALRGEHVALNAKFLANNGLPQIAAEQLNET
jgi:hypothetical protein